MTRTTIPANSRAAGSLRRLARGVFVAGVLLGALAGCKVGPNYPRPEMAAPQDFRENQGWKPATPAQVGSDAPWWSMYNDNVLDGIERQVEVSNQNLKAAEAQYRAAVAEVGIARGQLLPTVNLNAGLQGSGGGSANSVSVSPNGSGGGGGGKGTVYSVTASGNWDLDVWGRIRRTVEADVATAQASAADLAAAKLSAQTTLAEDYFQMRAAEAQQVLLQEAVKDFTQALQITKNRLAAGTDTEADVAQAQTQVDNALTQEIDAGLTRAKMEHAIALLIGKAPAQLSIPPNSVMPSKIPVIPAGIPSALLERRPDVAATERQAAAASANIGVAVAAWYPDITLTGSYGFASTALGSLFSASTAIWGYGAQAVETLFNGGAREAQIRQARANYDVAVAQYRQAALTAFQQVEDELATLRILEDEQRQADQSVTDARRAEQLTTNQYKAGVVDFTSVVTAQTTRLTAEVTALNILNQRLSASSALVNAVGGGWDEDQLPKPGSFYSLPKETAAAKTP